MKSKRIILSTLFLLSSVCGCDKTKQEVKDKVGNNDNIGQNDSDPLMNRIFTNEAREKIRNSNYTFNPEGVLIKQQENYDLNSSVLSSLEFGETRTGHNLVYIFDGKDDGDGNNAPDFKDISKYRNRNWVYGKVYLWEDGLLAGRVNNVDFKGYWFNSSLNDGVVEGKDVKDCLQLITNYQERSNVNMQYDCIKYDEGITSTGNGNKGPLYKFFTGDMRLDGYLYHPVVDFSFDLNMFYWDFTNAKNKKSVEWFEYTGNKFNEFYLDVIAIYSNGEYRYLDWLEYSIYYADTMLDKNGCFTTVGNFPVRVTYKDITKSIYVNVREK